MDGSVIGTNNLLNVVAGNAAEMLENSQTLPTFAEIHLLPLADNGGPTKTHALSPISPAIDAGDENLLPTDVDDLDGDGDDTEPIPFDQRGFTRIVDFDTPETDGSAVDIGAYELQQRVANNVDFNGDSRGDEAFFDPITGNINVLLDLGGGTYETNSWGNFDPPVGTWSNFQAGDFNGDGRADLAARDATTNYWTFAISDSTQFSFIDLNDASLATNNWSEIAIGDFDNDESDELLSWNSANWEVLDYDEKLGASLSDWGTAVHQLQGVTPADIQIGDTNRDGRDDLIAYDTDNAKWWVGLSQYDAVSKSNSFAEQDWDDWFDAYDDPVTHIVDNPDAPIQKIIDEFESVYNTVELELYRGFMKGIEATDQTKAGNPFDQAALLVDRLDALGFDADIAIGTIDADWQVVRDWIGAPDNQLVQGAEQTSVLNVIQAAFDPDATSVGTDIRFDHAWVQVIAPTSTGLSTVNPVYLDPSWKFKDRQPGILADTVNGGLPIDDDFITSYLSELRDESAVEYFENNLVDHMRSGDPGFVYPDNPGISHSDIPYDGPIHQKSFSDIPVAFTSADVDVFQDGLHPLNFYSDLADIIQTPAVSKEWTHRVELDLRRVLSGSSGDGTSILTSTELLTLPEIAIDQITITYAGDTPQLHIGDSTISANDVVLAADTLKVRVSFYNPGEDGSSPDFFQEGSDVFQQRYVGIGLNVGQHSSLAMASMQQDVLSETASPGVEDVDDLLTLIAAQYWYDVEESLRHSAAASNAAFIRGGVSSLVVTADPDDLTVDSSAPYGMLLGRAEIDRHYFEFPGRVWSGEGFDTSLGILGAYEVSRAESSVLEKVFGTESVSSVVGLQRAYQETFGYDESKSAIPFTDDELLEIRVTARTGGDYVVSSVGKSTTDTTYFAVVLNQSLVLPELKSILSRHYDNGVNWMAEYIYSEAFAADTFLQPFAGLFVDGEPVTGTVFRVPKSLTKVGNWYGSTFLSQVYKDGGTGLKMVAGVRELGGQLLRGGVSGGIAVSPSLLVPSGKGSFQPIDQGTVNLANGNLLRGDSDIRFPNIGVPLDFDRHYNSQSEFKVGTADADVDAQLGSGWTHSFSDRLLYAGGDPANPDFVWVTSNGNRHGFAYDGSKYITSTEIKGTFTKEDSTTYKYLDRDGMVYKFESGAWSGNTEGDFFGRLIEKVDLNSNGVQINYDDAAMLHRNIMSVQDVHTATATRRIEFDYYTTGFRDGLISKITKFDNDTEVGAGGWTYDYEDLGTAGVVLSDVTSPTDSLLTNAVVVDYEYHPSSAPEGFQGNLSKVTEPNGDYRSFEYYMNGRAFKTIQSVDNSANPEITSEKTYAYNLITNTTTVTDERGNIETYRYQGNGLLTTQIHSDRSRMALEWGKKNTEAEFLLASRTDEMGAVESFSYYVIDDNDFNDPSHGTKITTDFFRLREMSKSVSKRFLDPSDGTLIGQDGLTTHYEYDDPAAGITKLEILTADPNKMKGDGDDIVTHMQYDMTGRIDSVTDPLMNVTEFHYFTTSDHKDGLIEYVTNPRGVDSYFDYDAGGNITSITTGSFAPVIRAYDHNGRVTSFTDQTNRVSLATFDVLGRRHSTSNTGLAGAAAPITNEFDYDESGQLIGTTDALGRIVSLQYDNRGNVIERTNADGTKVFMEYDSAGNLVAQTDELNRKTSFVYDNRNRLIQVFYPDGTTSSVRYDGAGRAVELTNERDNKSTFTYDAAGRLAESIVAVGEDDATITNRYDVRGNLIEMIAPDRVVLSGGNATVRGNVTQFTYDALNRVIRTHVLDEEEPVLNDLDAYRDETPLANITVQPKYLSTTRYDENGNVDRVAIFDSAQFTVGELSDPNSLIIPQNLNDNKLQVNEYVYDDADRRTFTNLKNASTTVPGTDLTLETVYDDTGRVRFQKDELSRPTEFVHDTYGRLDSMKQSDPDAAIAVINVNSPTTTYQYDDASNVVAVIDANQRTTTFEYDTRSRLVSSTNAEDETSRIVYDPAGQIVNSIDALERAVFTSQDGRGRTVLQRLPVPDIDDSQLAPETRFEYDSVGNLISTKNELGYTARFEYDSLQRLEKEYAPITFVVDDIKSPANDSTFEITFGSGTPVTPQGAFGDDATEITGGTASWKFEDLPAGNYRVLITWDGDASDLDSSATATINNGSNIPVDQTKSPDDEFRDHQGQWHGWKLLSEIAVPDGDGDITVTLSGTGTIHADAVQLEWLGASRTYEYDDVGNLIKETDSLGRFTTYAYDELSRLTETTLPDPDLDGSGLVPLVFTNTYDGYSNLKSLIEQRGGGGNERTTAYEYDNRNRIVQETLDDGGSEEVSTKSVYDDVSNLFQIIEADGESIAQTTQYAFDNINRLKTVTQFVGAGSELREIKSFLEYDKVGNLTKQTDGIVYVNLMPVDESYTETEFTYDGVNRLLAEMGDAAGAAPSVSKYDYDDVGNLVSFVDPTGRATSYVYDRLSRITDFVEPVPEFGSPAPVTKYEYDLAGQLVAQANGEGEKTQFVYDSLGQPLVSVRPDLTETVSRYDSEGNLLSLTDANQNTTTYQYDNLNRLAQDTNELGYSRFYTYDDKGELTRVINRNEKRRDFTYDGLGRLVREDWWNNTVDFFDPSAPAADHLVHYLAWEYDKLGRVIAAGDVPIEPEKAFYTQTSNVEESPTSYWDTYTYDNLGRVTEQRNYSDDEVSPGSPWRDITSNPLVKQGFVYDVLDSLDPDTYVKTQYSQQVSPDIATPSFAPVGDTSFSFDRLGRLGSIDDAAISGNGVSDKQIVFDYEENGLLKRIERTANADQFHFDTSYAYDGIGRLLGIEHLTNNAPTPIVTFDYGYDAASRITQLDSNFDHANVDFARSQSFNFDPTGQLTNLATTQGTGANNTYTYDDNGNRKTQSGDDSQTNSVETNNQISTDGEFNYFYDREGNLIRKVRVDGTGVVTEYVWDHRNRLVEEREFGSEAIDFNNVTLVDYLVPNPTTVEILNDGTAIRLEGYTGRAIDLGQPYDVTASTILEFDFHSSEEADLPTGFGVQALGFDDDPASTNDIRYLQLFGTSSWGNYISEGPEEGLERYSQSDGVKHYRLRVGSFYEAAGLLGQYQYLFLTNESDGNSGGNSTFSNLRLYEENAQNPNGDYVGLQSKVTYRYNADDLRIRKTTQDSPQAGIQIDFDAANITPYANTNHPAPNDFSPPSQTSTVVYTGGEVALTGNTRIAIDLTDFNNGELYQATANTIIEFDFKSSDEAWVSAIGLDTQDDEWWWPNYQEFRHFKVYGADPANNTWLNESRGVSQYDGAGSVQHYRFRLGDFYQHRYGFSRTLPVRYLALQNLDNFGANLGESIFSNIQVYEGEGYLTADEELGPQSVPGEISYDFNNTTLLNYAGSSGNGVTISGDGTTLTLTGDTHRAIQISPTYQLTTDTVLEFDFSSSTESRLSAIFFENQTAAWGDNVRKLKLFGWDSWHEYQNEFDDPSVPRYTATLGQTQHYRIRLGAFYAEHGFLGDAAYLVFMNHTAGGDPAGESVFSNVRIYEQPASSPVLQGAKETEHYVYDGGHRVLTLSDEGQVKHRYTYAPGVDHLLVDEVFDDMGQVSQELWAVTDHLGTVHELVDGANHNLVEHREYDAFGNIAELLDDQGVAVALDQMASDVAFAGRTWDNDAELYYNRARWYDANLGRFISEDPIGFAGGDANLYRYAENDTVNQRDPSGLFFEALISSGSTVGAAATPGLAAVGGPILVGVFLGLELGKLFSGSGDQDHLPAPRFSEGGNDFSNRRREVLVDTRGAATFRPANLNTSSGEVEPLGGNSSVNDEATDNSAFLNRLAQRRPPSVPQTLTVDTVVDNVLYFGRVYAHFLGIELETAGSTITETGRAAGDFFGDHISQAYYDPSAEAERVKRAAISTAVGASNAAQYIYNNPTQALSAAAQGTVDYLDRLTSDPTVSGELLGNYAVSTALWSVGAGARQAVGGGVGYVRGLRAPAPRRTHIGSIDVPGQAGGAINPGQLTDNCVACAAANLKNKLARSGGRDFVTAQDLTRQFGAIGRHVNPVPNSTVAINFFNKAGVTSTFVNHGTDFARITTPGQFALFGPNHVITGRVLPNGKRVLFDPQLGEVLTPQRATQLLGTPRPQIHQIVPKR